MSEGSDLACFNLNVYGPESEPAEEGSAYRWSESDRRVLANLPAMLQEIEENLTGMLPEGYWVRIREWDSEENG